ncbi:MAG: undecaprenyldiphospho-muramoylpentapeptide beta-N-acetylglucosaminyltransferase [Lachnospiraceae bacterium]|nr:undecaprenyldiphospho-muramoylpentapeptide beta-N-acetylglucosaminyltransferase [Lachnospiraceae bacterium]
MSNEVKRVLLTGGGTGGHVTPHLGIIPKLKEAGYELSYIGSYNGIEKKIIDEVGLDYYGISTGKLRRYFDWKNFTDPFRVIKGYFQAKKLIKKLKPSVVFSKGGFVSVPVVYAAGRKKIPVIIHESDITPGLANKLSNKYASKVCVNFPETLHYFSSEKAVCTGTPIREELFKGDAQKGRAFCGIENDKPVILVMGGSTGAQRVNEALWNLLPTLLQKYEVVHLCGKGKMNDEVKAQGYHPFEYISDEMADLLAMSDVIVSRAGANAIMELLALKKPNILIPYGARASRGDQILNADSFQNRGYSYVLNQEDMTNETLLKAIEYVYENKQMYVDKMAMAQANNAIEMIVDLIKNYTR